MIRKQEDLSQMSLESFIAGFAYGGTTVFVGQPLDTIKTLQQAGESKAKKSIATIAKELYNAGGIPAFYRGGFPLLLGGGLMRSAQCKLYFLKFSYRFAYTYAYFLLPFSTQTFLSGLLYHIFFPQNSWRLQEFS